jgi:hypothetical protein
MKTTDSKAPAITTHDHGVPVPFTGETDTVYVLRSERVTLQTHRNLPSSRYSGHPAIVVDLEDGTIDDYGVWEDGAFRGIIDDATGDRAETAHERVASYLHAMTAVVPREMVYGQDFAVTLQDELAPAWATLVEYASTSAA